MFSDPDAARWGLLIDYAMDMYTAPGGRQTLNPPPDPRLEKTWRICGYITGNDALFRLNSALQFGTDRVFYGFLAASIEKCDEFVAVIRGTDGILEWIEDAQFMPMPDPRGGMVEQGFWQLYQTMKLRVGDCTQSLAAGVTEMVGHGLLTVVGHSLGSTLATYLTLDLAAPAALGSNVTACLFASPQTGDGAFVERFRKTVAHYQLFNYELDIVPRVPRGPGYATLPEAHWISPFDAQALIRFDVACNHHILSYCALLDYTVLDWAKVPREDQPCVACIRGPVEPPATRKNAAEARDVVQTGAVAPPIVNRVELQRRSNGIILAGRRTWRVGVVVILTAFAIWLGVRIGHLGNDVRFPIYGIGLFALFAIPIPEVWRYFRSALRHLWSYVWNGQGKALLRGLPITFLAFFNIGFTARALPRIQIRPPQSTAGTEAPPQSSSSSTQRESKNSDRGNSASHSDKRSAEMTMNLTQSIKDVSITADTVLRHEASLQSTLLLWSKNQQSIQGELLEHIDSLTAAIDANTHESITVRRQMIQWMKSEIRQTAAEYRDVSGHLHMELMALGSVKNMIRYESCVQKASRVAGPFATFTSARRKALWNSFQARCGQFQSGRN